jgi:hypothetical protein
VPADWAGAAKECDVAEDRSLRQLGLGEIDDQDVLGLEADSRLLSFLVRMTHPADDPAEEGPAPGGNTKNDNR